MEKTGALTLFNCIVIDTDRHLLCNPPYLLVSDAVWKEEQVLDDMAPWIN